MTDALGIARALAGVVVVLLLPGYSLATALFPAAGSRSAERRRPIDPLVKLMLVPALSIVQVLLVVLVMFVLPWAVRAATLLPSLMMLSGCLLAIGAMRGHIVAPRLIPVRFDSRVLAGLTVGAVALVAAAAVSLTSAESSREMEGPQLWLVASSETPRSLEVGVVNGADDAAFRLSVKAPNDEEHAVLDTTILLAANESWTQTISEPGFDAPVETIDAVLTRTDTATFDPLRVRWVRGAG